jgi:glycosyltransferase involved in cell wall biosynthesis
MKPIPPPKRQPKNPLAEEQVFVIHGQWTDHNSGFALNQIARHFAERYPVLFVDLPVSCWRQPAKLMRWSRTQRLEGGMTCFTPLSFPRRLGKFSRNLTDTLWQRDIEKLCLTDVAKTQPPIVFFDLPWQHRLVGRLGEALSVYYAIDDKTVDILGRSDSQSVEDEIELLKKVDIVFAISESLAKKLRQYNEHVFVMPNGYNANVFDNTKTYAIPTELRDLKRPIIGFTGYISERIDIDGVLETARQRPYWSFVFIGPVGEERVIARSQLIALQQRPNIHLLGAKPFREMPVYVRAFDACFIPYCLSEFTVASSPVKAYEYLALGKPVVSTRVPDLIEFEDVLYFADSYENYLPCLEHALAEASQTKMIEKRIRRVADCTTRKRSEQVLAILSDSLEKCHTGGS